MQETDLLRRLAIGFGLLTAATGILGILITHFDITSIGTASLNNRTIALSAAVIWIFLGSVLAYQNAKPLQRMTGLFVQVALVLLAFNETIEFIFNVQGSHFLIENLFVKAGTVILGPSSGPISPASSVVAILGASALVFVIRGSGPSTKSSRIPDAISVLGMVIALIGITIVLSYAYGSPLMYGTQYIPVAAPSALAAFFLGAALVAAGGPGAIPVKYMIGDLTSARLLRVFLPLIVVIILCENIVFVDVPSWFNIQNAILLSTTLVIFAFATAYVVARVAGAMGRALDQAELELVRKNEDLSALNEELLATQEELRQTNDDLLADERHLMQKNEDLTALNEEITATQEELRQNIEELAHAEKEARENGERYHTLFETMAEGFAIDEIVLDDSGKPIDLRYLAVNPAFESLTGLKAKDIIGRTTRELFPDAEPVWFERYGEVVLTGKPVRFEEKFGNHGKWFDVRSYKAGQMQFAVIFSDITDRKKAEEELLNKNTELSAAYQELTATEEELRKNYDELDRSQDTLKQATKKLHLLNLITFSDIRNAIFTLSGYLELERGSLTEATMKAYLDKQTAIVRQVENWIQFAKNYQDLGLNPPTWQNVDQSFLYAISHLDYSKISRTISLDGLEIYSDPLLEKVFFNLADNVLRYGKTADMVTLRYYETPYGVTIVFEDNGQGITDDMKEKIFERRSEGKTGMGLFLAKEILGITGISIKETGTYGKGACFEISVRKNAYRFVPIGIH